MSYRVLIHLKAEKEISDLPAKMGARIKAKILLLESHPRPPGSKKLQNTDDYRLRAGDYRIIYSIDDSSRRVFILSVGHRREIYR